MRLRVRAIGWILGCAIVWAEHADGRTLRLHPCDGVGSFAKEFNVAIGTRIHGVRYSVDDPRAGLPDVILVRGPVSSPRASVRVAEAIESSPGVVSATWASAVEASETTYHVILRMQAEPDESRVARIGTLRVGEPNGSYVLDGESHVELGADLDVMLIVEEPEKIRSDAAPRISPPSSVLPNPEGSLRVEPRTKHSGASFVLDLPAASQVTALLYDVRGRIVRVLVPSAEFTAGSHRVEWDGCGSGGEQAAYGVYFVHVVAGDRPFSARIVAP